MRIADLRLDPIQVELTFVRAVKTIDHIHQGGFPRPVLAQQPVDLPLSQGEIHPVIGDYTWEALGDVADFEG